MNARRLLTSLALAVLVSCAATAAPVAAPAKPARTAARRPAPKLAVPDSLERARRVAPRTLDDIHIEGEIPVPQVLFITARDQRRFMEFQHHRYQRTSLELGRATPSPKRIVVSEPTPAERKENPR
jgi:TolA-binding protein